MLCHLNILDKLPVLSLLQGKLGRESGQALLVIVPLLPHLLQLTTCQFE